MEKQMEMDKAQFAEQLKNLVELGKHFRGNDL